MANRNGKEWIEQNLFLYSGFTVIKRFWDSIFVIVCFSNRFHLTFNGVWSLSVCSFFSLLLNNFCYEKKNDQCQYFAKIYCTNIYIYLRWKLSIVVSPNSKSILSGFGWKSNNTHRHTHTVRCVNGTLKALDVIFWCN